MSPSDYRRACERIAAHLLACAIAGGALTLLMLVAELDRRRSQWSA